MDSIMNTLDEMDKVRLIEMIRIKEAYLNQEISKQEARCLLTERVGTCSPDEFAYAEQKLKEKFSDTEIYHRMDDILELFEGILVRANHAYPLYHPLWVYTEELNALEQVLKEAELLLGNKEFIKTAWANIYDKLLDWRIHLSRKQNQLYPVLETHGFDRPTKIMWTFDDAVRDGIAECYELLKNNDVEEFLTRQLKLLDDIRDLMGKEREILFPTSFKLISDEEFCKMSRGDHEIGFVLISAPPFYGLQKEVDHNSASLKSSFIEELTALLDKYKLMSHSTNELDVATGKLSLERINLIFKHLPVDLSYVDENELVKFYSDTKHRIFPRSANVIGREVRNCHPAKSVHLVEEIIEKFRSGEQDEVEFWINKPEQFIYILYRAIRDDAGNFKGVLEMMQDCTRIRELNGSQTLLIWKEKEGGVLMSEQKTKNVELNEHTLLLDLFEAYPGLKEYMPTINPLFEILNSPIGKMMLQKATIGIACERTGMAVDDIIAGIRGFIEKQ